MLGSSTATVDEPPMPGHAEVLLQAMQVCVVFEDTRSSIQNRTKQAMAGQAT